MSTLKPTGLSPLLLKPGVSHSVNSAARELTKGHPVTFAAFREIPWSLFGSFSAGGSQIDLRTPYLDNEIVALAYQIPDSVRTSPLPALRFVKDNNPVFSGIPTDMGGVGEDRGAAAALRHVFSKATFKLDYLNNEGLPHWLSPFDPLLRRFNSRTGMLGLHKHLHYRSCVYQRELAGYVKDVLTDGRTQRSPFWNSDFLERMATEHTRGRKNYVLEINAVLTLEAVERLFFHKVLSEAHDSQIPAAKAPERNLCYGHEHVNYQTRRDRRRGADHAIAGGSLGGEVTWLTAGEEPQSCWMA